MIHITLRLSLLHVMNSHFLIRMQPQLHRYLLEFYISKGLWNVLLISKYIIIMSIIVNMFKNLKKSPPPAVQEIVNQGL